MEEIGLTCFRDDLLVLADGLVVVKILGLEEWALFAHLLQSN